MEQTKGLDLCLKGRGQFTATDHVTGTKECKECGLVVPAKRYYLLLEQSSGKPVQETYSGDVWQRFCIQLHILEGLRQ